MWITTVSMPTTAPPDTTVKVNSTSSCSSGSSSSTATKLKAWLFNRPASNPNDSGNTAGKSAPGSASPPDTSTSTSTSSSGYDTTISTATPWPSATYNSGAANPTTMVPNPPQEASCSPKKSKVSWGYTSHSVCPSAQFVEPWPMLGFRTSVYSDMPPDCTAQPSGSPGSFSGPISPIWSITTPFFRSTMASLPLNQVTELNT